jgi:hypothetical protein
MTSRINKLALTDSQRNIKKRQKAKAIQLFKSGDTAGAIEIIEQINKEFGVSPDIANLLTDIKAGKVINSQGYRIHTNVDYEIIYSTIEDLYIFLEKFRHGIELANTKPDISLEKKLQTINELTDNSINTIYHIGDTIQQILANKIADKPVIFSQAEADKAFAKLKTSFLEFENEKAIKNSAK